MNRAAPYAGSVRHAPAGSQEDRPPVMRVVGAAAAAALLRADAARDRCVLKIRRSAPMPMPPVRPDGIKRGEGGE